MLSPALLNILACPACKGEITPIADGDALFCQACGLKFPVREGIPVMLLDEAEKFQGEGARAEDR